MYTSVLYRQGEPLGMEEVELDAPQEGEVLVRMVASGVCHSCLHAADGSWADVPTPMVLGDEGAGVVEAIGPGVRSVGVGDHVILSWAPSCGQCRYCATGRPQLCARRPTPYHLFDGTTRMRWRNQPVYHYGYVASFAPQSVVPESCAVPIRKDMPLDKAALIGCSVMTGAGAVLNTAHVPAGASLVVFGAGGIGLNAIQGGDLAGATPLIAVDTNDVKLAFARQFGATQTINARQEDPIAAIQRLTNGGADYAIVAVGDAGAMRQAYDALAPGGTCVVIGIPPQGSTLELDATRIAGREKRLIGSCYGSASVKADFPRMVELYLSGKLKIDQLITRRYGPDEVNEAFRALAAGEVARGLIVF
ncbi:MAG TPA: Zn-dependent alcohol dehydrogenase [Chloroflexota bacterium]|nr:Zn-dependent alcohol dehydrogenase [Chloroflexota bacterium]